MTDEEMYNKICRDRFQRIESKVDSVITKIDNGLGSAVDRIERDLQTTKEELNAYNQSRQDHMRNWMIAVFGVLIPILFGAIGWMMVQLWKHMVPG